jgi:hexosaminidase
VKRFLDQMALHKLNVLHWHLTEDQGWRIEIKKYPRLTAVGAWRASSPVAGGNKEDDGVPHGGFYSQDEIREIVAYAAARFIRVMPEIELPGHSSAAIAAYPGLGNTDSPGYAPKVQVRWGIFPYLYAPKPATFQFLDDVLGEVVDLFPNGFVHIGGDEAKKDQWNASPFAQDFMRQHELKDAHELQSYFIRRAEKFLTARGRRLVGWDEIQEGGLAAGATMMAWRDVKWAISAARDGHDVVMAPTSHTYFDYTEGTTEEEGERVGRGPLRLATVYGFEPVPAELEPQYQAHVLGAQGQLWSEHLQSWSKLEFRAWPRLSALAEVVWSPREKRNYADFKGRLPSLLARFDSLGMNYRRPRASDDAPATAAAPKNKGGRISASRSSRPQTPGSPCRESSAASPCRHSRATAAR